LKAAPDVGMGGVKIALEFALSNSGRGERVSLDILIFGDNSIRKPRTSIGVGLKKHGWFDQFKLHDVRLVVD
jgi:hypothetical protein